MSARDAILERVRRGRGETGTPVRYAHHVQTNDLTALFVEKAKASIARVTETASIEDAPEAIWAILSAVQTARLHLPAESSLRALAWHRAPGLTLSAAPPSGDDTSVSAADYGIAETGTLALLSGPRTPASWHFRPGREIVVLMRASIVPRLEDLFARIGREKMPATMNLITGPSRTADVEQTIELGAHGPREVHILLAG
jgi:L-lactate dehydrogenase complex protein LldG